MAELPKRYSSPGSAFSEQAWDEERLYSLLIKTTAQMLLKVKTAVLANSLTTASATAWWRDAVTQALIDFGLEKGSDPFRFLQDELADEEMGSEAYSTAMAVMNQAKIAYNGRPTAADLSRALDEALDLETSSLVSTSTAGSSSFALMNFSVGNVPPSIIARMTKTGTVWRNRVRRRVRTGFTGFSGYLAQATFQMVGRQTKTWVSHHDERVRSTHLEADGQTVPVDKSFEVGGELLRYPGDRAGTEEEIANCRCAMISRS